MTGPSDHDPDVSPTGRMRAERGEDASLTVYAAPAGLRAGVGWLLPAISWLGLGVALTWRTYSAGATPPKPVGPLDLAVLVPFYAIGLVMLVQSIARMRHAAILDITPEAIHATHKGLFRTQQRDYPLRVAPGERPKTIRHFRQRAPEDLEWLAAIVRREAGAGPTGDTP